MYGVGEVLSFLKKKTDFFFMFQEYIGFNFAFLSSFLLACCRIYQSSFVNDSKRTAVHLGCMCTCV